MATTGNEPQTARAPDTRASRSAAGETRACSHRCSTREPAADRRRAASLRLALLVGIGTAPSLATARVGARTLAGGLGGDAAAGRERGLACARVRARAGGVRTRACADGYMDKCAFVCARTEGHMDTQAHARTRARTDTCPDDCTDAREHACSDTLMRARVHGCMGIPTCVCAHVHTHVHSHVSTRVYTCVYAHVYSGKDSGTHSAEAPTQQWRCREANQRRKYLADVQGQYGA